MEYSAITVDARDDVVTITLNRPEKMNALSTQMRAEVTHAFKAAPDMGRVAVLTGAGRAFCSGQDLSDRSSGAVLDLERTLRDEYVPMLRAIIDCPIPTIAAVNGPAAGAGANLALVADVVMASTDAYFVQAFARIGLIPDAGGTWFLPRQIGLARAMGAALFTDKITAQQAADWGMIYEVAEAADFEGHWRGRALQLATGPTQTYGHIKAALRASFDNSLEQQLELEAKLQGKCGLTRDFTEGVVAFMEKRPAAFQGR
ncbi:enoyl-CoA hydratase-related protein [Loktanella salsilacus]|jgi:2-(1,2-epoxy-1,2-dihydrophenyl)acetyl-CoA isomerase|uniref:2-(1,2-epoxy-1,2-dihydrophenyl)acetyl-CoA isomerase n=1 Tax=Loktanella salsilacus TaxID=195913 RepID=A0A1I4BPW9_9RHOB|nr:enoyl-CoA hydratase-related protein [Loktanella salsilacus]MBU0781793.1 enoyl-CoA hydratase/isomerase family protein [Alphaproteobacteria bacterium]MBU1836495.1 enoyl-CoA hydratase/isomerase family protein [Alphaproteobacteria bacterium]UTH45569.1 enoyl-CoA hydratase/isomerase family protein [Loktanella salsilacus]SFK69911.1 2-(1,2-epoxy-1,2-dihydrophenyl)acetyl-CoA isomerase [Loktanella salsilacus]